MCAAALDSYDVVRPVIIWSQPPVTAVAAIVPATPPLADPFRSFSASPGSEPEVVQVPSKGHHLRVHVGPRTAAGYVIYSFDARALTSMQLFAWLGRVSALSLIFESSVAAWAWLAGYSARSLSLTPFLAVWHASRLCSPRASCLP
jgi:hypothetical protein